MSRSIPLSLSFSNPSLAEWAIIFGFGLAVYTAHKVITAPNLPPGPKGLPLLGNVLEVATEQPEVQFQGWAAKFGHVMCIHLLGRPMVILSSRQAAQDLLEKRFAIYSDRPRLVLHCELMGWQDSTIHLHYGPRFRKHRRFINQTFNERASAAFRPLREKETLILLDDMTRSPNQYSQHFRRFAAAMIFEVTYGYQITSARDEYVLLGERAGELTLSSGTPAAALVDYFPLMKYYPMWMPGSTFQHHARAARDAVDNMMNIPFEMVKKAMRAGTATPCFVSALLEEHCNSSQPNAHEDEIDIRGAAGTLYFAGGDTILAVWETFILGMVQRPDVFKKAQEEIDRVIGNKLMVTVDDRNSLPYLENIIKEVYRWNPPAPMGLSHRVMEDDVYDGFHIPKGANILVNIYAMLQDCPQSRVFRPERYVEDPDLPDPREYVFSFGRRMCPGKHFGEINIWYLVANIIAFFEVSRAVDDDGNEIIPPLEVIKGPIRHPKPFACSIRIRSEKIASRIQEARGNVKL